MEEIFSRAENGSSTLDGQISWLNRFDTPDRGETSYTEIALGVRDSLIEAREINGEINGIDSYDKLDELKSRASSIEIGNEDVLARINDKEQELDVVEVEQQEEFLDDAESLKYTYYNSDDEEEKQQALDDLYDLDKVIASRVKGWSTRRKNEALRIARI